MPDQFILIGKSYPVNRVKRKKSYKLSNRASSVQYEIISLGRNYLLRCEDPDKQLWSIQLGSYTKEVPIPSLEELDLMERVQSVREIMEQ